LHLKDGESEKINHDLNNTKLIISYKDKRAQKDAQNRKRGLEKLEKNLKAGKFTKKNINNKGYNKYLKLEGEVKIEIDYNKYKEDAKWDGLKGHMTNIDLKKEKIIQQYGQLWEIEKTFRISKSDLQIRPIFHHLKKRIEAHIFISFAACKIYKELERQLKEKKSELSPEKAIDILKTIYEITIRSPFSNNLLKKLILKTDEQKDLIALFRL
jgi:transposase